MPEGRSHTAAFHFAGTTFPGFWRREKRGGVAMNENHKKAAWIAAVVIFLLFCGFTGWFVGIPMVRLVGQPEKFRLWVEQFGIWGRLVFVVMFAIQVLVAFIPGEPLELAAGYAFGFVEGTILSMAGILLGSWLVFYLVRRFGVKMLEVFFSKKDIRQMGFLKNPQKTKVVAFLLMLIPGTPKDFLSYFAGLTKLTNRQWLTIVGIARIPSLITSTTTGAAAGEENYLLAALMFAMTLLLSGAGLLYYRKLCKEQNEGQTEESFT